ncbi:hypothetical protein C4588_06535 [Candidatus Parcubacteria bacterium]|nr:MAG: hypothetical protein C4588_06535 [Candidatus Parcubacteria bacterium]
MADANYDVVIKYPTGGITATVATNLTRDAAEQCAEDERKRHGDTRIITVIQIWQWTKCNCSHFYAHHCAYTGECLMKDENSRSCACRLQWKIL